MSTLQKSLAILTEAERRRAWLMGALAVIVAVFEVAGVSSILPFLSVLADPSAIERHDALAMLYRATSSDSVERFLLILGGITFVFLVVSAAVRAAGQYALDLFTQMLRHTIGERLLDAYLRHPYEFFLNRHTGDLAKGILSEVDQLIGQVYQPATALVAGLCSLIAVAALIVAMDPWIALSATLVLAGSYAVIYAFVRQRPNGLGTQRLDANRRRFEATGEALGGVKDIKLVGVESVYLDKFSGPSHDVSHLTAIALSLGQLPKYIIEAVAFGGILLLSLTLMEREGEYGAVGLATTVPLIGLYALAGYRMLPAVQAIYRSATQLRFGAATVDSVYAELEAARNLPELESTTRERFGLRTRLEAASVHYVYPGSDNVGIHGATLTVEAGSTLGIIGTTGAGKTTFVDLLLGLLAPTAGAIIVDGEPLTAHNLRNWQANIGYVPQSIFLIDASLSANIAFGIDESKIDEQRVRECAQIAQIAEFIDTLPERYATRVGERGVRLSGGQRQRIGIARALYRDPDLLVLDEATSALDNRTEQAVMDSLRHLRGRKTIVMIAHRLSTVQQCDQIAVLDGGEIVATGTFSELQATDPTFQKISSLAHAV